MRDHGASKTWYRVGLAFQVQFRHLAQKAEEILGAEGTEEKFPLGYRGRGDCHLVSVSPPLPGDRRVLGGGDCKGARGYNIWRL